MKNDSIAILFDQLGPYHWARLQAAARLFRVIAIETCAITREYQWERMDEPRAFDRVTLFDDVSDGRSLKRVLLRQKLAKALCEVDPAVAMIPGWGTPASLIALEWCLRNRRPAVVMSESNLMKRDTPSQSRLSELLFRCFPLDWPADSHKWNI